MDLNKRNVVVVGPNSSERRALQLALELEGYGVHATESVKEAHRLIEQHWPEAVVIDVADGRSEILGLARHLRTSRLHRHVVVVASAPVRFATQERAAYEAGCDVYLINAGQTRELAEILDTYLLSGGSPSEDSQAITIWN
jgi:CheY-like chemotaxis protein